MPATWPTGLTYLTSRSVYAVQALGQAPLKSQAQSGRTRQRPQYTLRISTLTYGWEFRPGELARFRAFVAGDLGDGTAEFTMPVWIETAQAYQPRTVLIRDASAGIQERKLGPDRTLVSCSLDVRNL